MDRNEALKSAAESRYWTEEDGSVVLHALAESGLSLSQFAREHGINVQRIRWWKERLQGGGDTAPAVKFAEVVVRPASAPTAADGFPAIVVLLPSGVRVTAAGGARPAEIAEVVRALRDAGC